MKIVLSKLAHAVVPLGLLLGVWIVPARAEIDYPFCKTGGGDVGLGIGTCKFTSLEQCRQSSAGYGMCYANQAYVAPAAPAARRAKR
jgi:uncharacterized protein DUF3551